MEKKCSLKEVNKQVKALVVLFMSFAVEAYFLFSPEVQKDNTENHHFQRGNCIF